jgi:tetratricopeptide (TPR) repeat protein
MSNFKSVRLVAVVGLGLISSAAPGGAQQAPPTAAVVTMADCTQANDRVRAIMACDALIKEAGRDIARLAPLLVARAAQYQASGRPLDALSDLSGALAADPKNAVLWTKRGDVRAGLGQRIRSAADYSVALKYDPKSVPALLGRGEQFRLLGALQKSVEDMSAVLAIDPRSSSALAARAYANERLGRVDGALKDADEALKLDANATLALLARGLARQTTDKAAAVGDLRRVLQLDPKSPVAAAALKKLGG